jgi:hypothetical protein
MGHLQSPGGIIFAVKDILSKYDLNEDYEGKIINICGLPIITTGLIGKRYMVIMYRYPVDQSVSKKLLLYRWFTLQSTEQLPCY